MKRPRTEAEPMAMQIEQTNESRWRPGSPEGLRKQKHANLKVKKQSPTTAAGITLKRSLLLRVSRSNRRLMKIVAVYHIMDSDVCSVSCYYSNVFENDH